MKLCFAQAVLEGGDLWILAGVSRARTAMPGRDTQRLLNAFLNADGGRTPDLRDARTMRECEHNLKLGVSAAERELYRAVRHDRGSGEY